MSLGKSGKVQAKPPPYGNFRSRNRVIHPTLVLTFAASSPLTSPPMVEIRSFLLRLQYQVETHYQRFPEYLNSFSWETNC